MITNILASMLIATSVGMGATNKINNDYVKQDNPNYVVYDDEEYFIQLTLEEITTYTWDNLRNTYNIEDLNLQNCYIDYDSNNFDTIELYRNDYISYMYNDYSIDFNLVNNDDIYFTYHDNNNDVTLEFEDGFTLYFTSSLYNQFKTAIELDIQANTAQTDMGGEVIDAITSGLGLIGDLAAEFLAGFSTLFWNSSTSTLTPFAIFALVMLGIAITMAVVSLVLRIIRGDTGA